MMKVWVFIFAFFSLLFQGRAQSGEEIFKTSCSACHTINKGRLLGPDLTGVYNRRDTEWLISFIRSSQQMIKSGDPEAVAIYNEYNRVPMPDNNLTDQQIISIIDYIREVDGIDSGSPGKEADVAADTTQIVSGPQVVTDTVVVNEETVSKGKSYFYGFIPFESGAAPCLSCHKINDGSLLGGGRLAIDLTTSYTKLGAAGISAILMNPPFPAMKAAMPGVLTEIEMSSLNSLLKSAANTSSYRISFPQGMSFFVLAFLIGIFIAVLIFLIYDDRNIPEGFLPGKNKST